jgi:RNA polymerase sigma factor (sigma-70 family)
MRPADDLPRVFLANRDKVLRYLRSHGAGEDAEDLLQDLWVRIEQAAAPAEVTTGYLMRMAHNMMIDRVRSSRQRRLRDHAWHSDGPIGGEADDAPDAERVLLSRERLRLLERTLAGLGPRTEAILRRHRLDGVSQRDLADEFGISLSAVEKQLQKAYKAIALAQIAGEGETR